MGTADHIYLLNFQCKVQPGSICSWVPSGKEYPTETRGWRGGWAHAEYVGVLESEKGRVFQSGVLG